MTLVYTVNICTQIITGTLANLDHRSDVKQKAKKGVANVKGPKPNETNDKSDVTLKVPSIPEISNNGIFIIRQAPKDTSCDISHGKIGKLKKEQYDPHEIPDKTAVIVRAERKRLDSMTKKYNIPRKYSALPVVKICPVDRILDKSSEPAVHEGVESDTKDALTQKDSKTSKRPPCCVTETGAKALVDPTIPKFKPKSTDKEAAPSIRDESSRSHNPDAFKDGMEACSKDTNGKTHKKAAQN